LREFGSSRITDAGSGTDSMKISARRIAMKLLGKLLEGVLLSDSFFLVALVSKSVAQNLSSRLRHAVRLGKSLLALLKKGQGHN